TARALVYAGDGSFPGITGFFEEVESYRYKLHVRVFLSRYRSQSRCATCRGARLKPAALAVRVAGLTIAEFAALTVEAAVRLLGQPRRRRRARPRVHRRRGSRRRARTGLGRAGRRDRLRRLAGGVPEGDALADRALRHRTRGDPPPALPPRWPAPPRPRGRA